MNRAIAVLGIAAVSLMLVGIPTPESSAHSADPAATYVAANAANRSGEKFVQVGSHTGVHGARYAAYERTYRGLPVLGGDFVVATDSAGVVLNTPLVGDAPITTGISPTLTKAQATVIARAKLAKVDRETAELVVFSPDGEQRLAYEVILTGRSTTGGPSVLHVVVDALTGAVIATWDEVMDGVANGYYYPDAPIATTHTGGKYELTDPSGNTLFCGIQGNGPMSGTDDVFGNRSGTDLETACADGYYSAQQYNKMLRGWLGRDGLDGNGKWAPMFVGLTAVNAYWNGHTANFGRTRDGARQLVNLDIVAHEFGHGVFQHTPGGFDGYAETYQLNEASSDIMGALNEHFTNNPNDPPDYQVANETSPLGRGPERIMYQPSLGPRDEPDCYLPNMADIEVHDGAGPANHFFYLMAEGSSPTGKPASPICAGGPPSVTGMGIRDAGKVWMESLMLKKTFWTYTDARVAGLTAVKTLYPGDCAKFDTVKGAWDAVAVPAKAGEPGRPSNCGNNDFAVSLNPVSGTLAPGAKVTTTVSTTGAAQTLSLSADALPAGVTASFDPPTMTVGGRSVLTLTASTTAAAAGTANVLVRAAGQGMTRTATYALTISGGGSCTAQSTAARPIADLSTVNSPLTLSGCAGIPGTSSVDVDISHTFVGDLVVSLIGPDGKAYVLHNRTGGSGKEIKKTYTVAVTSSADGVWTLRVEDKARYDAGTLNGWKLSLS
ncbi:Aminopeptidase Y (Arg, Lys, Leu preference) [Alloactinosynnema sp. L-07]|uniref:proprotein convertase P-domain-containing protein n=1 Tax=Alloactinosynnema sp. L-07 TaxID=1653480 RepID=UPI00065F0B32|nr:proprotein convertase P-domain-containing protein [Alloactinosynnema sp. L-07]CRK57758.1 Aminopeptidase Y (Arg, Lys, Leu preference) [Alloactinosynnema sp. L-07]